MQTHFLPPRPLDRRHLIVRTISAVSLAGFGKYFNKPARADSKKIIILSPQEEEGPFFVDEKLNRSDIRSDPGTGQVQKGLKTFLNITVSQVSNGNVTPLPNAYVDLWEANALGVYSDEQSEGTSGIKYLRGYQITDANGRVHFITIYPGWYGGRTAHIHCRVRLYNGQTKTYDFSTQFFFDDATTNTVYANISPYDTRGTRDTTNSNDRVYNYEDCTTGAVSGTELTLNLTESPQHAKAHFHLFLDLSATVDKSCIGVTDGGVNEG